MADKNEQWMRSPEFRKYFGSVFGITEAGNVYRLEIGNERIQPNEKQIVNVSECQIILPKESFDALLGLMLKVKDQKKKK